MPHELSGRTARAGRHQSDLLAAMLLHQAHGFGDVAVIAHHDRAVIRVQPPVIHQMHGEIDVRALLLCPDHIRRAAVSDRMRERRVDPVAEEVPEIHLDLGPVTAKRTEVDILALRLGLVGGRPRHSRREVLDRENVVMRLEDLLEQRD